MAKSDKKRQVLLEALIITKASNANLADKYAEVQLPVFKGTTGAASLGEARTAYCGMDTSCRQMFQRCVYC